MNKDEKKVTSGNHLSSITGSLPFDGRWIVGSTPDKKIPSHGTDRFGVGYAIDFMAVDSQNKTSGQTSWRTVLSSESPEIFYAFGKPIYSPVSGRIISIHNGEPDHEAYRSLFTLIPYAVTQMNRVRQGPEAIAGNYIVISPYNTDFYIAIVHLQLDSLTVHEGRLCIPRRAYCKLWKFRQFDTTSYPYTSNVECRFLQYSRDPSIF